MKILMMRHGDSVRETKDDINRSLTMNGINESRQIAKWLKDKKFYIDCVLTSPYRRTIQTLLQINSILNIRYRNILSELKPQGKPSVVIQYLKTMVLNKTESVLLISHLPFMSNLVKILCPNEERVILFQTSSITCMHFSVFNDQCKLLWDINSSDINKKYI
ncbi:phosphohistidine phosphatase SixA [Candidatus Pantoea edessiphila]|nr:phosphohistidine phosphatase SixA [Candidatus Pantoea edessiphila]